MTVLFAPAKLTTSLRVTGVRDDGLHTIDAEMVTVDLFDELRISDGWGATMEGPAVGSLDVVDLGDQNLVCRAMRRVGIEHHIRIIKNIPAQAGLGGGSSNAAAILQWAGYSDVVGAAELGADVAFCLVGGRARVSGIGEIVEPLPDADRTFTLFTPPFGCATPAVYQAWDRLGGPSGGFGNDLEAAAIAVEPRMAQWRDHVASLTDQRPRLAGSGSTWFVEGAFVADGAVIARTIAAPNR